MTKSADLINQDVIAAYQDLASLFRERADILQEKADALDQFAHNWQQKLQGESLRLADRITGRLRVSEMHEVELETRIQRLRTEYNIYKPMEPQEPQEDMQEQPE